MGGSDMALARFPMQYVLLRDKYEQHSLLVK